jgi:hypothetical protein
MNHATVIAVQDCRTADQLNHFLDWHIPKKSVRRKLLDKLSTPAGAYDHH